MPDLKYSNPDMGERLSGVPDYPERAFEAIREMHRQVGDLTVENGVAMQGVLVRHLVLAGSVENSKGVLAFLADHLGDQTYVNLMSQYRPAYEVPGSDRFGEMDRRITRDEYQEVAEFGRDQGLARLQTDDWIGS